LAACTRKCVDCLNIEQEVNVPEGEWTYAPDEKHVYTFACHLLDIHAKVVFLVFKSRNYK